MINWCNSVRTRLKNERLSEKNRRSCNTAWKIASLSPTIHPAKVQFRLDKRLSRLYRLQSLLAFQFNLRSPQSHLIARKNLSDPKMEFAGRINFEFQIWKLRRCIMATEMRGRRCLNWNICAGIRGS